MNKIVLTLAAWNMIGTQITVRQTVSALEA